MDWTQVLVIIAANVGFGLTMFLWLRSEANADRRDIAVILKEIKDELKDFHGRLCEIEAKK